MASGIYEIVNQQNGKRYVGSATNLDERKQKHFSRLRNGTHENTYFQQAFNECGEDAFEFHVLEEVSAESLLDVEQERIDGYDFEKLYNLSPTAGSRRGTRSSAETRAKISAAKSNPSSETRARMSAATTKQMQDPVARAKVSAANKRRVVSDETRAKMSVAQTGRAVSDKTRAKMSRAQVGNQYALGCVRSDETRTRMSMAQIGHVVSDETRVKLSAAQKGRVMSDEVRAKMRVSQRERRRKEGLE